MQTKSYLRELSEKDKRLFYNQEIYEDYSRVKIYLILSITLTMVCDITYSRIIRPLIDSGTTNPIFTLDVAGLFAGIGIYSLSFSKPFQKKTVRMIHLRSFLNSFATCMLSIYVFYIQFEKLRNVLITKQEANWINTYLTLSQAIYMILGMIMVTPVWYLKALVVVGYYSGISAAFFSVGHSERFWTLADCLMGITYSTVFLLLTANFRWKLFLKGLEADAWNQVYTDILDRNPSSIAVMQSDGQIIYSNGEFKALTKEKPEDFFKKVGNLKMRISVPEVRNVIGFGSMSVIEESKDLLQLNDDHHFGKFSSTTTQKTFRLLNAGFQCLADLLDHYKTLLDTQQTSNSDQAAFDGKLNDVIQGISLSYEIIIRPLAEDKKLIVILNDTTERDLVVALENNNEYKDQLLASVSHELRTPLNGNLGLLQAAIQDINVPHTIKNKFLVPALRSGKLLAHMINDILDYSQLQMENIVPTFELRSLKETLQYCYQLLETAFLAKNLTFDMILDGRLPSLFKTDHDRLSQVVLNLLSNALKFTVKGGVTIEAWAIGNNVEIRVKDTGLGINPKDIPKLFEEAIFSEKELDVKKLSKGVGLGLKVANKLAHLLGTDDKGLQVESIVNRGSAFWFNVLNQSKIVKNQHSEYQHSFSERIAEDGGSGSLKDCSDTEKRSLSGIDVPLESSLEGGKMMKESVDSYSREKQTWLKLKDYSSHGTQFSSFKTNKGKEREKKKIVLIVDDDPFNIIALESLLNHLDLEAEAASNGRQAVDKVAEDPNLYQLILMDCQMPVMNGYEATMSLVEMMKKGEVPEIPIIGCTAFSAKEKLDECLKSGMKEVIHKPVMLNKLKGIIDMYLQ